MESNVRRLSKIPLKNESKEVKSEINIIQPSKAIYDEAAEKGFGLSTPEKA
jgi:hypothetical protein